LKFRDHPLLAFAGRHSWPPVWTWIGGERDRYLKGELGVLKGSPDLGATGAEMFFSHRVRERFVYGLHSHCRPNVRGFSITAIGDLSVDHLL
jgi:hypothetical protein